jgi:circadian clock protein KaiB
MARKSHRSSAPLAPQTSPSVAVSGSVHSADSNHDSIFKFRLYLANNTANSLQALANLSALCAQHLPNRHEIEVVDVFRHPDRAKADGVRMTPTLLKIDPAPEQRIIGTLSDTPQVLRVLGLAVAAA